jgi:two-component system, NtrC family, sensor histidine kinase HydH
MSKTGANQNEIPKFTHDLRSPLYAVKGMLEACAEHWQCVDTSSDAVRVIRKALQQLDQAFGMIAKLNRLEEINDHTAAGTDIPTTEIARVLESIINLFTLEFEFDSIRLFERLEPGLPEARISARDLEEILFNLVANACYAMHGGGILNIRVRQRQAGIEIEVSDSGCGMSQQELTRIFEPFSTTKGRNGCGLGLYVVRRLVERNQGDIQVSSRLGKGTIFKLRFHIHSKPKKKQGVRSRQRKKTA